LLYATYQPLRFAIEDPERQARYAAVFAVTAGAFVPLNFIAVRLSTAYVHPRVLGSTSNLPAQMALTFVVSLIAFALTYATLCSCELATKRARFQLKALRREDERAASEGGHLPSPRRAGVRAPLQGAGTLAAPAQRGGA
jgi:heme exporter protein C